MTIAITGGRFKGSVLRTPSGKELTRPTSGKVRQALFNILRDSIEDSDFLDLYAGSGSVGLEALSRGCRRVTLVESHPAALRALEANCRLLLSRGAGADSLEWIRNDSLKFCASAAERGSRFDVVFADPPFSRNFTGLWERMKPLLADGGAGVVQFPTRSPPDFIILASRLSTYGESSLAVFEAGHC